MKIGLIGVPGSGKSGFAAALRVALETEDAGCVECRTPIVIVDDYIQEVEDRSRLALGFDAAYVGNLHVALERAALERTAIEDFDAKTTITCGTLIETSAYLVMDFESTIRLDNEDERDDTLRRAEASMKILSCLFADTFRYDHLFYLPAAGFIEGESENMQALDRNLQASFSVFPLVEIIPLVDEDRLGTAMKHILGGEDESNTARQGASPQAAE